MAQPLPASVCTSPHALQLATGENHATLVKLPLIFFTRRETLRVGEGTDLYPVGRISMGPQNDIIEELKHCNKDELSNVLPTVNAQLKTSLSSLSSEAGLKGAVLARYVLYYALSIGEETKTRTARTSPRWNAVISQYEDFRDRLVDANNNLSVITKAIDKSDLVGLCYFSTRKTGSTKQLLYVSLLLFIIYADDEGWLDKELLRVSIPDSERQFVGNCRRYIISKLNNPDPSQERGLSR
jgi:hypothetical protein